MGFLGFQIVITMVTLSVMHRISQTHSFARWFLSKGLFRYLHPSDEELRQAANIPNDPKPKGNRHGRRNHHNDVQETVTFTVPRSTEVKLHKAPIQSYDLLQLHYYPDYQWLVDFAFCAMLVYSLSEIYFYLYPINQEFNLSMIWCLLMIGFSLKILSSLTGLFFRGGDEAMGERNICIVFCSLSFFIAMLTLLAESSWLEFNLTAAYESFSGGIAMLMASQGLIVPHSNPMTKLLVKFWLAVVCALFGTFFVFPGMRYSKMHVDLIKSTNERPTLKALYQLNFIAPMICILFWVRPLAREYLTERNWPKRGILMGVETFESLRLVTILLVLALRLALMPKYMQAYLELAREKMSAVRRQAGKISNIELQKMVARIFYYLCVVALQILAPLFLCLFMTLLLKTCGDYNWVGPLLVNSTQAAAQPAMSPVLKDLTLVSLRQLLNPTVVRAYWGFLTWWVSLTWFLTSLMGYMYHVYFPVST